MNEVVEVLTGADLHLKNEAPKPLLFPSTKVTECGVSVRARKTMLRMFGWNAETTLVQVSEKTYDEVFSQKNCGAHTVQEIERVLARAGLTLRRSSQCAPVTPEAKLVSGRVWATDAFVALANTNAEAVIRFLCDLIPADSLHAAAVRACG